MGDQEVVDFVAMRLGQGYTTQVMEPEANQSMSRWLVMNDGTECETNQIRMNRTFEERGSPVLFLPPI